MTSRRFTTPVYAAITGTALAGALGLSAVAAAPVSAQTAFVPGTGTSSAGVARIQLRSSGAAIGFGLGVARTRFAGAQGNAEAANVDLGLFDTVSKAPLACGYSPGAIFPAGSMPSAVVVSSGEGATSQQTASAGAGSPVQLGSQYGAAAPNSSAEATVDGMSMELPGLLQVIGGTASSAAKLTPGKQRDSSATSAVSSLSLAGGAVQLHGIQWTASHRSGAATGADGGFSVASIIVGGQALPTGDMNQLRTTFTAVNTALAATGLSLNLPTVTKTANGVVVSPLRLSVAATPQVREALSQALIGIQPIRTQLLTFVTPLQMSPDCGMAKALGFGYLVVDLATLVLGDGGAVDLDLGGSRAGTDGTAYANPFDSGFGLIHPPALVPPALPGVPVNPPTVGAPSLAAPQSPATVTAPTLALHPVSLTPTAMSCRSTHGGGCTTGHGRLAAWIALCLIAALAAADRLRAHLA
ncbi:MAG TPA: hypothetical protein VE081_08645 [Sporichthyaceae bacterium]|nr:hypothetical protein [Sporichthyaceae bacterium]